MKVSTLFKLLTSNDMLDASRCVCRVGGLEFSNDKPYASTSFLHSGRALLGLVLTFLLSYVRVSVKQLSTVL